MDDYPPLPGRPRVLSAGGCGAGGGTCAVSPGPWCLSVRTRVVSVCLDACGVCLSLHACSVAMPAHRSGWGTRVRGSVTEPSAGEQQLPFLITAIIKALMMGRVLRPPAWHRGGWQELFAQLKPLEMSELGGGWWGQDELVATQGLSPHSLGVATGSSIGMENISCVTAAQCRAGRNCPTLPGPISSSWLLWMFSQNDPLCL